jgi:hypothetical protein
MLIFLHQVDDQKAKEKEHMALIFNFILFFELSGRRHVRERWVSQKTISKWMERRVWAICSGVH